MFLNKTWNAGNEQLDQSALIRMPVDGRVVALVRFCVDEQTHAFFSVKLVTVLLLSHCLHRPHVMSVC